MITKRASIWASLFGTFLSEAGQEAARYYLGEALGGEDPPACMGHGEQSNMYTSAGVVPTDDGPKIWNTCYISGDYELTSYDVNAMACLLNYHRDQKSVCISVEGTICANGYDGPLKAARGYDGSLDGADYDPTVDEIAAIVTGLHANIGVKIDNSNERTVNSFTITAMKSDNRSMGSTFDYWFDAQNFSC